MSGNGKLEASEARRSRSLSLANDGAARSSLSSMAPGDLRPAKEDEEAFRKQRQVGLLFFFFVV